MEYHKDEIAKALDNVVTQDVSGLERISWIKKYLKKEHDYFTFQEVAEVLSKLGYKGRTLILIQSELNK